MNEYMNQALQLAREAANEGEVPVGAVVVKDGIVIATGRNRREQGKNALCHAEIEAIDNACKRLGGWRLWQCELRYTGTVPYVRRSNYQCTHSKSFLWGKR